MSETVSGTTIYQRIGGEAAISAAVDRFYERVLAHPTPESFFQRGQHGAAEGASVCLPVAGIGRP
jgi:truncated hemoglobin YjbI